jgi:cell shape-determining protein MreC
VLFVATRNIIVAFWLTIVVVIVLGFLFNENSALSIFGQSKGTVGPPVQTMTPEEVEIFRRLNEKRMRNEQASQGTDDADKKKKKDADPWMVYMANMSLLGN